MSDIGYSVKREEIPALLDMLERARLMVQQAGDIARNEGRFIPPGNDPYSPAAAQKMGDELVEDHNVANKQHVQNVQNVIDSLNAAMASYDNAEHAGEQSFKGKHA